MAELPLFFDQFLRNVRPTQAQREDCKTGHETLRRRLGDDESLKGIIVDTFLQGSYRRATAVRPTGDSQSDVDVITVTRLDKNGYTPRQAMKLFVPFLEKHYKDKWKYKGRAFGISLSYVELDLVITAAPSEVQKTSWRGLYHLSECDVLNGTGWIADQTQLPASWSDLSIAERATVWKLEPLDIPDREANEWDKTHPLAQIVATWTKNSNTNGHYVNVVKALKWWKVSQQSDMEYPKGYPLEHLLWISCCDGITSIAKGVTLVLRDIMDRYKYYADSGQVPYIPDHGVPEHNVLGRLSPEDFRAFHQRIGVAADQARDAYNEPDICESAEKWRCLFGPKFPQCLKKAKGGYTRREGVSTIPGGRFA